jgi:hypothetical protein
MTAESAGPSEFERWYFERRRAIFKGEAGCGAEEELLDAIRQRIKEETDEENRRGLKFTLSTEYAIQERYPEAEVVLLGLHDENPDEPLPLISLAGQKLYYEEKPEAAMPIINRAIEVAYRSNVFRRLALGTKARIAHALKEYGIVEDVLNQLMQLKFGPGDVDCGIERDFLDRLPAGTISEEVARKYDRFSQRKNSDEGTNP